MRTFTISKNPHGDDKNLFSKDTVTFNEGITPLVGCNGSGKTTLLMLMRDLLNSNDDVLVVDYNDRVDGGTNRIGELMLMRGDTTAAANMLCSSEGERINQSVGFFISKLGSLIRRRSPREVWVLMDAVGSGLSIDYIDEIKEFVSWIRGQEPGIAFYFVVATNEYEFARNAECVDVTTFTHRTFKNYDDYRNFILSTRKKKDKRYQSQRPTTEVVGMKKPNVD